MYLNANKTTFNAYHQQKIRRVNFKTDLSLDTKRYTYDQKRKKTGKSDEKNQEKN